MGYGPHNHSLEAVLGSIGSPTSPQRVRITSHHQRSPDLPGLPATRLHHHPSGGTATFLRHPITWLLPDQVPCIHNQTPPKRAAKGRFRRVSITDSPWARLRGYGNINPLSIDYACRPRLRSRLTLGGLTWPRNPWSSGGGGFHSSFATHACILTRVHSTTGHPAASQPNTTLPYPATQSHCRGFGGMLEPHYIVGAGPLDQ